MVTHKETVIADYVIYKSASKAYRLCCVIRMLRNLSRDERQPCIKFAGIYRETEYSLFIVFDLSSGPRFVCNRLKVDHGICSLGIHDPAEKKDTNHFKVSSSILHVLSEIHRIWKVLFWIAIMVET